MGELIVKAIVEESKVEVCSGLVHGGDEHPIGAEKGRRERVEYIYIGICMYMQYRHWRIILA